MFMDLYVHGNYMMEDYSLVQSVVKQMNITVLETALTFLSHLGMKTKKMVTSIPNIKISLLLLMKYW